MPPVHGVQHDVRMRIASPPRTDVLPSFKLGGGSICAGKTKDFKSEMAVKMEMTIKWQ